jgi:hypothetical protein
MASWPANWVEHGPDSWWTHRDEAPQRGDAATARGRERTPRRVSPTPPSRRGGSMASLLRKSMARQLRKAQLVTRHRASLHDKARARLHDLDAQVVAILALRSAAALAAARTALAVREAQRDELDIERRVARVGALPAAESSGASLALRDEIIAEFPHADERMIHDVLNTLFNDAANDALSALRDIFGISRPVVLCRNRRVESSSREARSPPRDGNTTQIVADGPLDPTT